MQYVMKFSSVLLLVASVAPIGFAADTPLVDAANRRAARHPVVDVRLHVNESIIKGGLSALTGSALAKSGSKMIPAEDLTVASDNRWVLDGNKYRFENNHPMWNMMRGEMSTMKNLSVSDGDISKTLHTDDRETSFRPWGVIHANLTSEGIQHAIAAPLAIHFRGNDKTLSFFSAKELKLQSNNVPANGVKCDEYRLQTGSNSSYSFYFDPTSDHVLRKLRKMRQGKVAEQYDVEYAATGSDPTPSRWTYTRFGADGKALSTSIITVTEIRATIPDRDSAFQITFPADCRVHDQRHDNKQYRVNDRGDLNELDVYGKPIESIRSDQDGNPINSRIVQWIAVGLALTILGFFLYWRIRKRDSTQTAKIVSSPFPGGDHA